MELIFTFCESRNLQHCDIYPLLRNDNYTGHSTTAVAGQQQLSMRGYSSAVKQHATLTIIKEQPKMSSGFQRREIISGKYLFGQQFHLSSSCVYCELTLIQFVKRSPS
jgi:hypothetical protein